MPEGVDRSDGTGGDNENGIAGVVIAVVMWSVILFAIVRFAFF